MRRRPAAGLVGPQRPGEASGDALVHGPVPVDCAAHLARQALDGLRPHAEAGDGERGVGFPHRARKREGAEPCSPPARRRRRCGRSRGGGAFPMDRRPPRPSPRAASRGPAWSGSARAPPRRPRSAPGCDGSRCATRCSCPPRASPAPAPRPAGRAPSTVVCQVSARRAITCSSRSRKPAVRKNVAVSPRAVRQGQRVAVVVRVAVVEGDRHLRSGAWAPAGGEVVQRHHGAVPLQPLEVAVEELRAQRQIAPRRVDRVVAEHDPAPGEIG